MDPKRVIIYTLFLLQMRMLTRCNEYEQTHRYGKNSFVPDTVTKWRLQAVKRSFVQKTVFSRVSSEISVGVQFRGKGSWIRRVRAPIQRLFLWVTRRERVPAIALSFRAAIDPWNAAGIWEITRLPKKFNAPQNVEQRFFLSVSGILVFPYSLCSNSSSACSRLLLGQHRPVSNSRSLCSLFCI